MNRALRAATMGALLLSPIALTACSAGQVTQTATQDRDKVGPSEQVGDILLRQILLAYPDEGLYEEGDDAELLMSIVNTGLTEDTLVSIEGEAFDEAVVSGRATPVPASPGSPSASPEGTATLSPDGTATPSPDGTATPAAPTTPAGSTDVDIPIPANSAVYLGSDDISVELTDLAESLTTGQRIELTLTFAEAGEVTVPALVAAPEQAEERGEPFDFHEEEEGAEGEEVSAESGSGE